MDPAAAQHQARVLLELMLGGGQQDKQLVLQHLTIKESKRYLLAHRLNSNKAARALAERCKHKARVMGASQQQHLADAFYIRLCVLREDCVLRVKRTSPLTTTTTTPQDMKAWLEQVTERVANRMDLRGVERVVIEVEGSDEAPLPPLELLDWLATHLKAQHPNRVQLVRLVNFPQDSVWRSSTFSLPVEFVDKETVDGGEGESIYEDAAPAASATAEFDSDDDDEDIGQLLQLLRESITRSDEAERVQLQASARLLTRPQQREQPPLVVEQNKDSIPRAVAPDAVPQELLHQLATEMAELDALKRAVAFARNFMDLEERERREFQQEMEAAIVAKQRENAAMVERLQYAFGSDAAELLM